jgi:hypothetical protein
MYSHFPKKANIPVILLPLNIVFHTVFVDVSNIAVLQLTITFWRYVFVADFEALHCQATMKFEASHNRSF